MQTLTREEAIKRIRDIRKLESVEHLKIYHDSFEYTYPEELRIGAMLELMAIFDIKESEL